MTTLIDAFNALEERKKAVLGDDPGLTFSASTEADSLIMSGFDLDHSEVDALGGAAGTLFFHASEQIPLPLVMKGAWVEGLLIGCMFSRLVQQEDRNAQDG